MSSLFKTVYPDGRVEYSDVNRVVKIDQDGHTWSNGGITALVDSMYPITMPYDAPNKPYSVYTEVFLVDPKNGDYDTEAITHLITPTGERVELNIYKAEKDGEMVDISKEEYEERKKRQNLPDTLLPVSEFMIDKPDNI